MLNLKSAPADFFITKPYWQIAKMWYYAVMNKQNCDICISKIKDFFDLILFEHNASREEIDNFLHDCLKFVFEYNNLNINDYLIQFHSIKNTEDNSYYAYMQKSETCPNYYDVYFIHDNLVFKEFSKNNLSNLFYLMFVAMHEFGHIIQYSKHLKHMIKAEIREYDVDINFNKKLKNLDAKKQNLVVSQYNRHYAAQDKISKIERNADYQAYKYCQLIFNALLEQEETASRQNFYLLGITTFNKIRKNRYCIYRSTDKENNQALKILKKYGIKKEDLFNY